METVAASLYYNHQLLWGWIKIVDNIATHLLIIGLAHGEAVRQLPHPDFHKNHTRYGILYPHSCHQTLMRISVKMRINMFTCNTNLLK